ncbi:hypothetical protein BH24ACT4_BH24ACT4_21390 [soil metagenome]
MRWEWEPFDAEAMVRVRAVEQDCRILLDWGDGGDDMRTLELLFVPWQGDGTYVRATETGQQGTGDEVAAHAAESTGGFTMVLCSLKALLEHDVALTAVLDRAPADAELPG